MLNALSQARVSVLFSCSYAAKQVPRGMVFCASLFRAQGFVPFKTGRRNMIKVECVSCKSPYDVDERRIPEKGMKMRHVRIKKDLKIADALTFFSSEREMLEEAYAGDIIGLHNHGTIQIGDTFTEGESLGFTGIPHFAPELFRRVRLKDPLKSKQLRQGLQELAEEGATQVFFPERNNDIILGAVGVLQFDVVASRLKEEYKVECAYEAINVWSARWIECRDEKKLKEFKDKAFENLGGFRKLKFEIEPHWAVLAFGLVHGLGLATKLQDLKLNPNGLVANLVSFNVGVEIGQLLALSVMLIAFNAWRTTGSFAKHAYAANVALLTVGFALFGYQLTGYAVS